MTIKAFRGERERSKPNRRQIKAKIEGDFTIIGALLKFYKTKTKVIILANHNGRKTVQ